MCLTRREHCNVSNLISLDLDGELCIVRVLWVLHLGGRGRASSKLEKREEKEKKRKNSLAEKSLKRGRILVVLLGVKYKSCTSHDTFPCDSSAKFKHFL